ncbi:MAG: SDR family NAD(P)-dependent oxidoreductase [Spirochaetes bacterium]|nr:SDR family NAD(P)-dependent oxidoreductase [Spirochaetota bacterium]
MRRMIENGRLPPDTCDERLDGKLCVVTGATSGVGLEAVKSLHGAGADILMINRDERKSEAVADSLRRAGPGSVDYLIADLSSLARVREAIGGLVRLERPVDVLINNAGVHMTRLVLTPDGLETTFAVNHMASFMITLAMLPVMSRRGAGRILQVNSQGHRFFGLDLGDIDWRRRPFSGLRAYGAAKTAQLLCCREFADRLRGTGVTVNAMHPGAVKTGIGENNGRLYRWYNHHVVWKGLGDPSISGTALHYLAAARELEGVSGAYFNLTREEKPAPHALDRELGKRVWELSLRLSGMEG